MTGATVLAADLHDAADRLLHDLVAGDEPEARLVCERLVGDGVAVVDLLESVVAPALREIGHAWQVGQLTVWAEHRASGIVERILGGLAPETGGPRNGTAVVASVSGEQHAIPCTMAAMVLREANWRVHHLGVNTPPDELIAFCDEHELDLAVIPLTSPFARVLAGHVADRIAVAGTTVAVGGPGRSLRELLATAEDARTGAPARTR